MVHKPKNPNNAKPILATVYDPVKCAAVYKERGGRTCFSMDLGYTFTKKEMEDLAMRKHGRNVRWV